MTEPVVCVEQLSFRYPGASMLALHDVSFTSNKVSASPHGSDRCRQDHAVPSPGWDRAPVFGESCTVLSGWAVWIRSNTR